MYKQKDQTDDTYPIASKTIIGCHDGRVGRDANRRRAMATRGDAGASSRSRTIVDASERLGVLGRARRSEGAAVGGHAVDARTLEVLVLGADRREGTTPEEVADAFLELATLARARCGVDVVCVRCVGPNVRTDAVLGVAREAAAATETRAAVRVEFRCGLFHECVGEEEGVRAADIAFAFNAGVWGYAPGDWIPTIERVVARDGTPLVLTSYSLREAESDEDAMRAGLSAFNDIEWVWEAEHNESCSEDVRELGFDRTFYMEAGGSDELRENSAWQCIARKPSPR